MDYLPTLDFNWCSCHKSARFPSLDEMPVNGYNHRNLAFHTCPKAGRGINERRSFFATPPVEVSSNGQMSCGKVDLGLASDDWWYYRQLKDSELPDSLLIESAWQLPSFFYGGRANQKWGYVRVFENGTSRKVPFWSKKVFFLQQSAALLFQMANRPSFQSPDFLDWSHQVSWIANGLYCVVDDLLPYFKIGQDLMDKKLWLLAATRFMEKGYTTNGLPWYALGKINQEPIFSPIFNRSEDLLEPMLEEEGHF